jgi:D-amino peptidase
MRIFISVDMEGISGVEKVEEIFRGMPAYETFRQIMAGDVNSAIQGAVDGGATDIVVADSHGYMCNIRPKDVHQQARLRSGMKRVLCQFKSFSHRFDAAFFVGYHSKAGTADGILSHTWIPAFQDVRVNGLSVGEYGLNGFLVGSFGVPPILLCGDDKTVEQARPVLGDIEYVAVKRSLGYFEGEHLPIAESHARIREAAKRAVERFSRNRPPPPRAELPVTFELDLARQDNPLVTRMEEENLRFVDDDTDRPLSDIELIAEYEPVEIRGPQTVSFTSNRYVEAYNMLFGILLYFYERDIEWLVEEVANPDAYQRDLGKLVGNSPLNFLG